MDRFMSVAEKAEEGLARASAATTDAVVYLRRRTEAVLRAAADYVGPRQAGEKSSE